MGVKINKVKDAKTQQVITTNDCTNGYTGNYICITNNCNAQMSFNPRHERRLETKTIVVEPYFKLKKGQDHSTDCPYNIQGSVDIIARDSDNNLIKSLDNGNYEFSLQILHTPENNQNKPQTTSPIDSASPNANNAIRGYQSKGTAPTYINTLQKILELRARVEENSDIAPLINLKHQGNSINWNKFYFDDDNYISLLSILKKQAISYPICICGTVFKTIQKTEKFPYHKIILNSPKLESEDNILNKLSINLILANNHIKPEDFSNNQQLLVYGRVALKKVLKQLSENPDQKINFLNVDIWINHKAQLVILNKI